MKKFLALVLLYTIFLTSAQAKDMRFIQVSDARYYKDGEHETLTSVIKDINKQKDVNFVIFTGDVISKPDRADLKSFIKKADKLYKPYYLALGDKDVNKHKKLSKKEYVKLVKNHVKHKSTNYVFESDGVVFFVVDGAKDVFPSTMGYYKEDTLEWLDKNLGLYPDKNVIILQHFPLIPPKDMETYMTYKPEKYLEVIAKHKNVKAVISGHYGVNKEKTVDGVVHLSTAPAPYYRIIDVTDCDSQNPTIWSVVQDAR